jgi:hypothetical protein
MKMKRIVVDANLANLLRDPDHKFFPLADAAGRILGTVVPPDDREVRQRIVIDGDVTEQLRQVDDSVDLCDASGTAIGIFHAGFDLEAEEADVDYEELHRRVREDKFISTAELLARLGLE